MPEELLPQIVLTGAGADLEPAQVLAHALTAYQTNVRVAAEARVLAERELTADILSSILMEVASGHLNPFRIAAGVAFRTTIMRSHARQLQAVSEQAAARAADDAAMNLGAYLAATSSNSVMDGYHLNVNAKVPTREAARRSAHAFGLTTPQMRTAFNIKDGGVTSIKEGAWKNLLDRFIERAFGQRVVTLVSNSLRQVENDATQRGWEMQVDDGTLSPDAQKMWITAGDERTCPVCGPMDGAMVGVMEKFHLPDGNRVKTTGVHPNCRCTCELVDEEISKAWEERQHPRAAHGRFGTKAKPKPFKEPEAKTETEQRLAAHSMLTGLNLKTADLAGPKLSANPLAARSDLAAASGLRAKGNLTAQRLAAKQVATTQSTEGLRTHAILGGKTVNLSRLAIDHQLNVAGVLAGNAEAARAEQLPDDLMLMDRHMVAFATGAQIKSQNYDGLHGTGFAQIDIPLRFVDRHNRTDVRQQLDLAMSSLDQHFRENDGIKASLAEVEHASDPGVQELGAALRVEALSSERQIRGELTVSVSPDDASEAWRYLLAERGAGYRGRYVVDAYDATGTTVSRVEVSAGTVAAMSGFDPTSPELPRVLIAPHGTWKVGTVAAADRPDHVLVAGPFKYVTERGIVVLTPDSGVYRRATPEN